MLDKIGDELAEDNKERVQFDFTPEALERMDKIKDKTGAATRSETLRNALRLYEWLVNEVNPESTIHVIDKGAKEPSAMIPVKFLRGDR